jgi:threonine dehydrogenase-like Zn-dependent dehydrogenase
VKALRLIDNGVVKFEDVPVPEIGDTDILIEIKACGICGSDLHKFYGRLDASPEHPFTMGHEFAGVVVKVGDRVNPRWKVGDRVVSDATGAACGVCPSCQEGHYINCLHRVSIGSKNDGGMTQFVKIPGDMLKMNPSGLSFIPDNISFSEATVLEPAANAYRAVIQEGQLHAGEDVVIFGAGTIGLMAVQMARIAGAVNIILAGLSSDRRLRFDLAKKFGATCLLATDEEQDLTGRIKKLGGDYGIALVIDAAGVPIVASQALEIVRNEGTIVRLGLAAKGKNFAGNLNILTMKSIQWRGHVGYTAESWRNCIALARSGKLDLGSVITKKIKLEQYEEGFHMMENQAAAKVVIVSESESLDS